MRKIAFMMMCAIISAAALFAAPTAQAAAPAKGSTQTSLLAMVPKSLVVEQTATLSDGRNVTVYYRKAGDVCEVYSADNLKGYGVNDLLSLKSTSFRVVGEVKGKRVYSTTARQARKLIKSMVNTYL